MRIFYTLLIFIGLGVSSPAQQTKTTWRPLFDGTSMNAWRGYKTDTVPAGWHIVDGTLAKETPVADLVTKEEFGDFELELDWKIGEAGNSGILYRGTEEYDHIYWSAPEYQLLDDIKATDNKTRLTCAALPTLFTLHRRDISNLSANGTPRGLLREAHTWSIG